MQHKESKIAVLETTDYSRFNMIKGNRNLDLVKIKKIMADIERGTNLLKYCPILVIDKNKKLDIVDGQHRFIVAKKVKSPVYYILAESLTLYDIARMNSNTEKWKPKDFIHCYTELGNSNYTILANLIKKYPGLPVTTAVNLLATGKVGGGGQFQLAFQRGEFVVTNEKITSIVMNAADQFQHSSKFGRPFMKALCKVIDAGKFPVEELIKKVNSHPEALAVHDHEKKYLANLEEIVGKGKQKRVQIY
jgi:hypothetical protein